MPEWSELRDEDEESQRRYRGIDSPAHRHSDSGRGLVARVQLAYGWHESLGGGQGHPHSVSVVRCRHNRSHGEVHHDTQAVWTSHRHRLRGRVGLLRMAGVVMMRKPILDFTRIFGSSRKKPRYQEVETIGYRVYTHPTKRDPYYFDQEREARQRSSDQIRYRGRTYYNSLKGNEYYQSKQRADRAARNWERVGHNVRIVPVRSRGRR